MIHLHFENGTNQRGTNMSGRVGGLPAQDHLIQGLLVLDEDAAGLSVDLKVHLPLARSVHISNADHLHQQGLALLQFDLNVCID